MAALFHARLHARPPRDPAMTATDPTTITATDAALALIAQLRARHPTMLFYQSGGCCEGSAPQALEARDLTLSPADDVRVGEVGGVPFWLSRRQCGYLLGQALTLDACRGSLGTFSLEDPDGWHFVTRAGACDPGLLRGDRPAS
ncbi:MAG: hypothetical protein RL456_2574 [Pseudomonadota bacterium]